MSVKNMRDAFMERVYHAAKRDKAIIIVSADMGAPALDVFRDELKGQFINTGISEQNAILVAAGLALAGKKPIAYAITQFISLRAYEQIRIYVCGMNLPVSIVGVGAGVGYHESGPTHHIIEDVSVMRALPNLSIYTSSDEQSARVFADIAIHAQGPKYIRLDRERIASLHDDGESFATGISVVAPLASITIAATGIMVRQALAVRERLLEHGVSIGVVDVYRIPADAHALASLFAGSKTLIALEEHTLRGGLGSYLLEEANDRSVDTKIRRLGMDTANGYTGCYNYGGREAIRSEFGLDVESITRMMMREARMG